MADSQAHYVTRELKIHRRNGETAKITAVDARNACRRHPEEWSLTPWSAEDIAAAKATEAEAQRESADD